VTILPESASIPNELPVTLPTSFDRWWHRRVAEPSIPVPRPAGVWDALLGGDTHSTADQATADDLLAASPALQPWAEQLVEFRQQAVTQLARAGCRQWLDLGPGLPTATSLYHDLCTSTRGEHTLACVDNDPFVLDCIRAYTSTHTPRVRATAVTADLRQPHTMRYQLPGARQTGLLDLTRPVTVIAGAVLHHLTDPQASSLLASIRQVVTPGSQLVVTHWANPDPDDYEIRTALDRYRQHTAQLYLRTPRQVEGLIGAGWTLHPPGIRRLPPLDDTIAAGWGLTATATAAPGGAVARAASRWQR
jgi:hypothetical protein